MAKIKVKDQILSTLNENKGTYYSGQDLADKLSVSRTAVWKAIERLREEGFSIVGSTNLGYALDEKTDILDKASIESMLSKEALSFYRLECVKEIGSTNDAVKERGLLEAEGLCIVAESQTKGKGRRGRSFFSPDSTGLYLSVLLKPTLSFSDAILITTAASVAAIKACYETNTSLKEDELGIKWVNDIFLNGKKISGILTEGSLSMETGLLDFAVLGIGFNLCPPKEGWPSEIEGIAGSLFEEPVNDSRNKLTAAFLNHFLPIYKKLPGTDYLSDYRKHQLAIGKTVRVLDGNSNAREAFVSGVNDRCELLVKYTDTNEETPLSSGEISIRFN